MTLKEKILQTFIVTVREINKHGGPEKFFLEYPVGGMYFWEDESLEGKTEIGTSTTDARLEECRKYSKTPLLVCGDYTYVKGQKLQINSRPLGSSLNLEDAYNLGKVFGMQMNSHGVDWILGPCIDMLYDRSMPLFAISDDPKRTVDIFTEVIKGIQDQGVLATIKHFPGLGTNSINMHFGHGRNVLNFDEWDKTYGYTYRELFKAGTQCVMTTHATLRSYANDDENGFVPIATYSSKLTTELLKNRMNFKGAVVTDALIMGGMATGNLIDETVQAFKAGADLLLWPPVEAADKIEELILQGEIPMSRLEDALARIGKMRSFREKAIKENKMLKPDRDYADSESLEIMKHGICLYKNNVNMIPFNKNIIKKILIVDGADTSEWGKESAKMLRDALKKEGFDADVRRDIYDVPSRVCWQDDIDELEREYDITIFNLNMTYATSWDVSYMMIWASQLFNKKNKVVINYGAPFFAEDYFEKENTIIEMNCTPSTEIVKVLVDKLMGRDEFTGNPVLTSHTKKI